MIIIIWNIVSSITFMPATEQFIVPKATESVRVIIDYNSLLKWFCSLVRNVLYLCSIASLMLIEMFVFCLSYLDGCVEYIISSFEDDSVLCQNC